MTERNDHLILSAAIGGFGFHPGAPRGDAQRLVDVGHYRRLVQAAERGLLDFVLLDDARALPADRSFGRLDALSVLSRLAPETSRVGLAVSKPTTYSEPFTVSRELATLDFVSGGRAAWNVTTNASDAEARNFGDERALPASERRAIAEEYVVVSRKLWDSWEDDAVITDVERGLYLDPHKLHHINHVGEHFQIRGPQITYRPPQGHVVVIATDTGDVGVPLSPAVADVLILHHPSLDEARHVNAQFQAEAVALGHEVRVLAATISTTYNQPYELARQLAGIDHVSDGRAAWNVVTSFSNSAAKDSGGDAIAYNFSKEKHLEHATRYDRARVRGPDQAAVG